MIRFLISWILFLVSIEALADFSCQAYVIDHRGYIYSQPLKMNRSFQVWTWDRYWFSLHFEPHTQATLRVKGPIGRASTHQSYPFDQNPLLLTLHYDFYTFQVACSYF